MESYYDGTTELSRTDALALIGPTSNKDLMPVERICELTGLIKVTPFVPESGYVIAANRRIEYTPADGDNPAIAQAVYDVITQAEYDAQLAAAESEAQATAAVQYAAYIAGIAPTAILFANTLRAYFPDLAPPAEQNHAVTEGAVKQYFIGHRLAGTMTVNMVADSVLLNSLFGVLNQADGTVWSLPWTDIWAAAQ